MRSKRSKLHHVVILSSIPLAKERVPAHSRVGDNKWVNVTEEGAKPVITFDYGYYKSNLYKLSRYLKYIADS